MCRMVRGQVLAAMVLVGAVAGAGRNNAGSSFPALASDTREHTPASSHAFIASPMVLVNNRRGYFDIGGLRADSVRQSLRLYGLGAGAEYRLGRELRLKVILAAAGGSEILDTSELGLSDGTVRDVVEFYHYRDIGIAFNLLYRTAEQVPVIPFVHIGTGLDYIRVRQEGRIFEGSSALGDRVSFPDGIDDGTVGLQASAGLGFHIRVSRVMGIQLMYSYRYWIPVRFDFQRDLPLEPVEYWESWRTHILQGMVVIHRPS